MGRDHTIFAKEKGYVVFYRDVELHEKRKYIGVVFERGETLPRSRLSPRRRRLGLVGREREVSTTIREEGEGDGVGVEVQKTMGRQSQRARAKAKAKAKRLELRPGYQFRESNWHIGRTAERANVRVREYKRGDRFLAWRKSNARRARVAAKRALSSRKKKGNAKRK